MDNLLNSVIDKAGESIVQNNLSKCLPSIPGNEEIEGGMDNMYENNKPKRPEGISDEKWEEYENKLKEKRNKAKEEMKSKLSDFKKSQEDAVKNAIKNNTQAFQEVKSDLKDLGTSAGLLTVGTVDFMARIALIPPALISVTPLGPGVSAQLAPPMLKSLKAEGDSLSKVYDDCDSKMNKLGLESMGKSSRSFGIDFGPISSVVSIVKTSMSTAKPLILAVGSSVGDELGKLPEIEPPISITYSAKDCSNFSYKVPPLEGEEGDITPENCSKFEPMTEDNTEISCNNCKYYSKK